MPIPAPASTYLQEAVEIAAKSGVEKILFVARRGPFAAAVASGARTAANRSGLAGVVAPTAASSYAGLLERLPIGSFLLWLVLVAWYAFRHSPSPANAGRGQG